MYEKISKILAHRFLGRNQLKKIKTFLSVWRIYGILEVVRVVFHLNKKPPVPSFSGNLVSLRQIYADITSSWSKDYGNSFESVYSEFLTFRDDNEEELVHRRYFTESYDLGSNLLFVIYLLISRQKVSCVVESGVAAGKSTSFILRAQEFFANGSLTSIDITSKVGELIPRSQLSKFNLKVLPQIKRQEAFLKIVKDELPFEIFLHDSDHSVEYQFFEIQSVLNFNQKIQWILVDDINEETIILLRKHKRVTDVWVTDEGHKFSGVARLIIT